MIESNEKLTKEQWEEEMKEDEYRKTYNNTESIETPYDNAHVVLSEHSYLVSDLQDSVQLIHAKMEHYGHIFGRAELTRFLEEYMWK